MNPFKVVWWGLLALLAGVAVGVGISYIAIGETPTVTRSLEILEIVGTLFLFYTFGLLIIPMDEDGDDDNKE